MSEVQSDQLNIQAAIAAVERIIGMPIDTSLPTLRLFVAALSRQKKRQSLRNRVLGLIPGTRQWRRAFARKSAFVSKCMLVLFLALSDIAPETRLRLRRSVRRIGNELAWHETLRSKLVPAFVQGAASLSGLISIIVPIFLVARWFQFNLFRSLYLVAYVVMQALAGQVMLKPAAMIRGRLTLKKSLLTGVALPLLLSAVFTALIRYEVRAGIGAFYPLRMAFIGALMSGILHWIALLISVSVIFAVLAPLRRHLERRYPIQLAAARLISILSTLQRKGCDLCRIELKQELVSDLETIASAFEQVPALITCGDRATDIWHVEAMVRSAASIRGLKRWVLTPKPDTLQVLRTHLGSVLVDVIEGRWDSLPREEPERIHPSAVWLPRLGNSVVVALIGSAPLLLLLVPQFRAIASTVPGYSIGAAVTWAVVVLIAALDPQRIQTLHEVLKIASSVKQI